MTMLRGLNVLVDFEAGRSFREPQSEKPIQTASLRKTLNHTNSSRSSFLTTRSFDEPNSRATTQMSSRGPPVRKGRAWVQCGTGKEKQGIIRKRLANSIGWESRLPYSCQALRR